MIAGAFGKRVIANSKCRKTEHIQNKGKSRLLLPRAVPGSLSYTRSSWNNNLIAPCFQQPSQFLNTYLSACHIFLPDSVLLEFNGFLLSPPSSLQASGPAQTVGTRKLFELGRNPYKNAVTL